jgi:hypothetical protein
MAQLYIHSDNMALQIRGFECLATILMHLDSHQNGDNSASGSGYDNKHGDTGEILSEQIADHQQFLTLMYSCIMSHDFWYVQHSNGPDLLCKLLNVMRIFVKESKHPYYPEHSRVIPVIIMGMRVSMGHAAVTEQAYEAVHVLVARIGDRYKADPDQWNVLRTHLFPLLALERWSKETQIQNMQTFVSSLSVSENLDLCSQNGAVQIVLHVISKTKYEKVYEHVFHALSLLSSHQESKAIISVQTNTKDGYFNIVLRVMNEYHMHENIQEHSCAFLVNMSMDPDMKTVFRQDGIVAAIVTAMTQFRSHIPIQTSACMCLQNLAEAHHRNHKAIIQQGGVHAIVASMQLHDNVINIKKFGCIALGVLCHNVSNRDVMLAAGAMSAWESAVGFFAENEDVHQDVMVLMRQQLWWKHYIFHS